MTRPFGLPERRLIVLPVEERPRREPDGAPADAVSAVEVPPDDVWYALDWMGAGPEERER